MPKKASTTSELCNYNRELIYLVVVVTIFLHKTFEGTYFKGPPIQCVYIKRT